MHLWEFVLKKLCLKKDGTEERRNRKMDNIKKKFFINPRKSLHENKVLTDGSS